MKPRAATHRTVGYRKRTLTHRPIHPHPRMPCRARSLAASGLLASADGAPGVRDAVYIDSADIDSADV